MKIFLSIIVALGIIAGANSIFTVDETQQVIIIQFGKYVRSVKDAGLHFKTPFIQEIVRYDKRLMRYDAPPAEFLTLDKKALVVDAYARFYIRNPLVFFQSMRSMQRADARLDAIISSSLREAVASHNQSDIITGKRVVIMDEVETDVKKRAQEFGIEVVDVRIKRTDFPREIAESIHDRMRAERLRISKRFRSEGSGEELKIKGDAEKQRDIIIASATNKSQQIRGEGDAESTDIITNVLKDDPEFYAFVRSLAVYREALDEDTQMILSASSPLFEYIEKSVR